MALGTAHGAQCYATQAEASAMACSALNGVSAAGAVSCVGVAGASSSSGGGASVTFTVRTLGQAGVIDASMPVELMGCETYGVDYWQPLLGAWVGAAIAIVAAKMAYQRIFGSPVEA